MNAMNSQICEKHTLARQKTSRIDFDSHWTKSCLAGANRLLDLHGSMTIA
jgi:hypothetical protein